MNVWARNDVWFTVQIWVPSGLVANKVADLSWTAILWCFLVGAVPGAVITGGPSDSDFMT